MRRAPFRPVLADCVEEVSAVWAVKPAAVATSPQDKLKHQVTGVRSKDRSRAHDIRYNRQIRNNMKTAWLLAL